MYSNNLDNSNGTLIIKIDPGEPIKVTEVNVMILGDGEQDCDYHKIIQDSKSFIGKVLNHNDYEKFKDRIYSLALFKGYFDAKFKKSQLLVIPSCNKCIWNIDFHSGKRYIFEDVRFWGSQINSDYLDNISNIHSGEYYSAISIVELNKRLSSTDWFESVLVSADSTFFQDKKVILNVLLSPKVKNNFEIGCGYTDNFGVRAKIVWKKPWINVYGHSLESNLIISPFKQVIDCSYKIPLSCNSLKQYYLLQGGIVREDFYSNFFDIFTINLARYWNFIDYWQCVMSCHWDFNCFIKDGIYKSEILVYPGVSINRIKKCGEIMPYWGNSQFYSIYMSNNFWKSGVNFVAIQAQNIWVKTFFKQHRILMCGHFHWIDSENASLIFSLLRCFFNDNRRVRGYQYQSKLNRNMFCIDITKSMIAMLEYQYNIVNKWWGVIFLDTELILGSHRIKWCNLKSGIGIGLRWQSPVGPIRLDIATPLMSAEIINYKFLCCYINVGPEL